MRFAHAFTVLRRRGASSALLAIGLAVSAGCTGPWAMETGRTSPSVGPSSATPSRGPLPDAAPQTQELSVQIVDGRFPAIRFNVRPGAVRLTISARGGPYTLRIDPLVTPHRIPADSTALVGFTAATPGEYVIELTGEGKRETAILDVRPAASP
jgi:hypothetical protein